MELLKERFVRGEIDKAEFEDKRQAISEPHGEAKADKEACC
jgi:hypothetical protein